MNEAVAALDRASRACEIAERIFTQLRTESLARAAHDRMISEVEEYRSQAWAAACVAGGGLGNALLGNALVALGRENILSDVAQYLRACSGVSNVGLGLHTGWSGAYVAAKIILQDDAGEKPFCAAIRKHVFNQLSAPADTRFDSDMIFGLPGVLLAFRHEMSREMLIECVERLLAAYDCAIASGTADLGFAHGTAGILCSLGLALECAPLLRKRFARRLRDALAWHSSNALHWNGRIAWPSSCGAHEPTRAAWCYGNPGIAIAYWHCGRVLQDQTIVDHAVSALDSVLDAPEPEWCVFDHAICHGNAGLALICYYFGRRFGRPRLSEFANRLTDRCIEAYDERLPLGYAAATPSGGRFNAPGLLEGAVGIALTSLTVTEQVSDRWIEIFGLCPP